MPEDSKPVLTPEAAAALAATAFEAQTAPLRVPPGCSVAVEMMDPGGGSAAGSSVPSQQPPEA